MRSSVRFITRPLTILFIILFIQLGLYLYTTLRPFLIAPRGMSYTVMGGNYFYPNMIKQAKDGSWGTLDINTTRPTTRVYAQTFFVIWGKIAAIFHIHQITAYRVAQVSGGIAVFVAVLFLVRQLLPESMHAIALLFVLEIETGPLLTKILTTQILSWPPSFDPQVSFMRHFGLPHHIWAETLSIVLLVFLIRSSEKLTMKRLFIIAALSLAATLSLPPFMLTMLASVTPVLFVWALVTKRLKTTIPPLVVALLVFGVTGLFIKNQFASSVPWKYLPSGEKWWWTNRDIMSYYLSSLTLYYPWFVAALVAAVINWKRWTPRIRLTAALAVSWLIVPFAMITLSTQSWFPTANFRLVDGYQFTAAGLLAAIGLSECVKGILYARLRVTVQTIALILIMGTSFFLTGVYAHNIWKEQDDPSNPIYQPTEAMQAIYFLDTLPKYSGILVREYYGEVIQSFANVRVFIGGPHEFPDWLERQWRVDRFFTGTLSDADAAKFLKDNDIQYVFYGPQEHSLTTTSSLYPNLLISVFATNAATVYKVHLMP